MVEGDIDLHQLYRALDVLATHKDEIEKKLFYHGRDLLSLDVDVVLYDLTTLRFESMRTDLGELRQFGYSKERRSDLTQVVLGLLVTPEGVPRLPSSVGGPRSTYVLTKRGDMITGRVELWEWKSGGGDMVQHPSGRIVFEAKKTDKTVEELAPWK